MVKHAKSWDVHNDSKARFSFGRGILRDVVVDSPHLQRYMVSTCVFRIVSVDEYS